MLGVPGITYEFFHHNRAQGRQPKNRYSNVNTKTFLFNLLISNIKIQILISCPMRFL